MRKIFKYCDDFINLGEIGEHELEITALNVAQPGESPRLLIKRAVASVRLKGGPVQVLDVTSSIRDNVEWELKVNISYRQLLESQHEEGA